MSRFTTYAIKEFTSSFLFLSILISGIIWLGQGLRHIDLLTSNNVSIATYSSYIILLLPKIILLTFPICLFLVVLFSIIRLRNDSELIIMGSSGKSERDILIKPIIIFTIVICIILLIFSNYITPSSLKEIRYKIVDIRSSGIQISLLKEKKFISPIKDFTIFLQEKEGNILSGLLIHDQSNANNPQTYIAENGEFISNNDIKILKLFNGTIQIYDKNDNRISEIAFDTYDLNLMRFEKKQGLVFYSDELSNFEIIESLKNKPIESYSKYEKESFAVLHSRFINPFYIFCYSLLPLLMVRFSRRPDESWRYPIMTVSTIAFIIQLLQITLSNLLIENSGMVYFNYAFPLISILAILILLYYSDFYFLREKDV